jgi:hypothetical protein
MDNSLALTHERFLISDKFDFGHLSKFYMVLGNFKSGFKIEKVGI